MNPLDALLAFLTVVLAYLLGAIPFGYLIANWWKGIDIRTVGSGNVGATNVGRVLGPQFFLLVFTFDVCKGLLPTLGLPWAFEALTQAEWPTLPVLVALGTILGHNFPVYLGFKGGKGVATSLGALLALEPVASLGAAFGFVIALLVTRIVSISSILGGVCFAIVYFSGTEAPFGRGQIAMSLLTIALLTMLVVRHRANLARIAAGTEPKVSFRRGKQHPPSGKVLVWLLAGLLLVGAFAAGLYQRLSHHAELDCGPFVLTQTDLARTGHQRAEDVAFADQGRILVVSCPRYRRVVFYRVSEAETLELLHDVALDGRPVSICAGDGRVFVLQRPHADARHLEEGYWETFDFEGNRLGSKFRVGWDPDQMVLSLDEQYAIVLTSGHAEGETGRPDPALVVVRLGPRTEQHEILTRLEFDQPGDDPERIILSSDSGRYAAVALLGTRTVAGIDLSDPEQPSLLGRVPLDPSALAYLSATPEGEPILMPTNLDQRAVLLRLPTAPGSEHDYLVSTLPNGSGIEVLHDAARRSLGRLPLRGVGNLSNVEPTALDYDPHRELLAVANRAGGVHLIAVRQQPTPGEAAQARRSQVRR